jgi:hypothetical protein
VSGLASVRFEYRLQGDDEVRLLRRRDRGLF